MTSLRKSRRSRLTIVTGVLVVSILVVVCIVIPVLASMADPCTKKNINLPKQSSLLQYFTLTDGIDIIWAHAVNSQAELSSALSDSKIMMLEADVLLGAVNQQPIMAHPPATTSDINLREWLTKVLATPHKGLKLDFKRTNAISPSLKILDDSLVSITAKNTPPILLNADILSGPNNKITTPVDSSVFIQSCSTVQDAILSPGWTTGFVDGTSEGYSWDHVKEMFQLVKDLEQFVTFPVRASLVDLSKKQLLWLIKQNEQQFSLTVWTSKTDKFDIEGLKFLRDYKSQVYFDLPQADIDKLKS